MLVKSNPQIWYCQACGEEQTRQSPAYMFPMDGENYIKICSECENKVIRIRIISLPALKEINWRGMAVDIR